MKGLGIVLLAAALTAFGWQKSARLAGRARTLQTVEHLCRRVGEEIRFTAAPPTQILTKIGGEEPFFSMPFLRNFCSVLPEKFHKTWNEQATQFAKATGLSNEETACFCQFGSALGTTDLRGQQQLCAATQERFAQFYKTAQEEYREKGRLYVTLGGISGAAAALIML